MVFFFFLRKDVLTNGSFSDFFCQLLITLLKLHSLKIVADLSDLLETILAALVPYVWWPGAREWIYHLTLHRASCCILSPALLHLPKSYILYLLALWSHTCLPNQNSLFSSAFSTNCCSDAFSTTHVQSRYHAHSRSIPAPCTGQRGFWMVSE